MEPHHHHHPGHAHPPATVSPSILRLSALERLAAVAVLIAALWGAVVLGDAVMSAALAFNDLTLGYDRHPAVHHLDGEVAAGRLMAVVGPNGAGKSTLLKGIVGMLKPLAGGIDLCGLRARDIAYLPQAADIDRTFPISVYDLVAMGLWRAPACSAASASANATRSREAIVGRRPHGLRGAADRHAVGRADAARAVRAAAAAGRARDPARRAVHRDRRQDRRRPARSRAALARREAHRGRRAARSRSGAGAMFPETLLLAREPVAWGATARRADAPRTC